MYREGDIIDDLFSVVLADHGQVSYRQRFAFRMRRALFYRKGNLAAHHHFRQLVPGGVLPLDCTNVFALARHGTAVRDRHNFIELVGNKQVGLSSAVSPLIIFINSSIS